MAALTRGPLFLSGAFQLPVPSHARQPTTLGRQRVFFELISFFAINHRMRRGFWCFIRREVTDGPRCVIYGGWDRVGGGLSSGSFPSVATEEKNRND
ncbi:hypothetical protein AVEN_269059-1 [Araneus ventricosus]|uniref:Uncharacterized protein n=1 Tax=Araneus ventricosus TaxID=182803 RepID=A0A4Y2JHK8_ARAVE|nr:hypothetical protein AVEN_269059-1 [Araneus ventricosus]